jgi:hypothetical protein
MDKDKKIKQLEALVQELIDENTMLWDMLEEIRESDIKEAKKAQDKVLEHILKNTKTMGDA